ncbi:MAG: ATP-dependent zinc metalloprotease FtsH [Candidatus Marinimicrobia bacterium]|nr:ATP-dependent zinc metalloprotease FtsH [Candidatus Neomarinimicrobiota bacterium]
MGRAFKTSLGWLAIVLLAFMLASIFSTDTGVKQATFTDLQEYVRDRQVASAVITGYEFRGRFQEPLEAVSLTGKVQRYSEFKTVLPYVDSELVKSWQENGLEFEFKDKSPGWFDYIWSAWPLLLIVFFWFFIMRRMQGGMGGQSGIFSFGKSKAKLVTPERSKVTFDDVAGADEAKEELMEIIEFLKNPQHFARLGGKIPKGALLLGPPGTGKTLLARAVAGEAAVPFFSLSGADFVEMFVGVGASRVRDLFENGKKNAPAIIFIDEIDAVGRTRGAGLGGGHDEREQTLNQLLVEMDGFETDTGVILLASTNRPDVLDKALLRPGRFDRQIIVDIPGRRGREGILKVHTKDIPLAKDVDLGVLARSTPGLVGADLANLVNEAALLAARKNKDEVFMEDIEDAKDKVMMGVERKSVILSEDERKTTAYHEAGHALVAYHTVEADPLHKITIIPRGRSLGVTAQLPIDDKHSYSRTYIMGRLDILMGGRVAEQVIFNEMTTGAGNDLEIATDLARRMVVEWGMSDKVGPTTLGKTDQELFLGREIQQAKNVSEETARTIDNEIKAFVRDAEKHAKKIITDNIDQLRLLGEALLKHETLHGDDIPRLFDGKPLQLVSSVNGKKKSRKSAKRKSATDGKVKAKSKAQAVSKEDAKS